MSQSAALLQESDACRIVGVQFGLLNPELVRRQSVVPITSPVLYSKQIPQSGGMNDLRMGTCDRRTYCATCRNDMIKCPGHFGHLDLAAPMYHVSMMSTVLKILRCVCVFCSHLLVDICEGDPRLDAVHHRDRLAFISNLCKSRKPCLQCSAPQPKYVAPRNTAQITLDTSEMTFEDETERELLEKPFTAARAREILKGISDSAVRMLGSCPENSRPEWMILTVLQIPPPISRPCITASDGSRTKGQDDVTVKLIEIFKANKAADTALRDAGCVSGFMTDVDKVSVIPSDGYLSIEDETKIQAVTTASYNLQQHLVQFFHRGSTGLDPKIIGTGGRSHSRTLRLIPDRWRGKKGRFRGNLGGKRVDYSSRTVASPAPDYDVDEVGIPEVVAFHLTFPERVTSFNKDHLSRCVKLGYGVKGGAASVIIPNSDPIDLELCTVRDSIDLEVGWIVERHLVDGDWVLLNRQPSLHRMSIMAHRVRIIPDKTFRLPVCDTTPYNADFDGDELNVHVLQTHDARAEAEMLMSVSTQMISPENNKPIVALVQDSLVAAFLMSRRDTFLEKHQAMQMIMNLRYLKKQFWLPPPAILKPRPLWTGKQILSLLFPDELMFDMTVRSGIDDGVGKPGGEMDIMERRVILVDGELMCGSLCKKTLGTSAGGIVHVLVRDWGFKRAGQFVSDAQRLLREYMMIRGFSVGVGDCVMGEETHNRVHALMTNTFEAADKIQNESTAPKELVGGCVSKMLGGFLTSGGAEVVKDVNVTSGNRISIMIESGAKGSNINTAQILSSVGQQSVEGGRIKMGVDGRTLPSFRHGDGSAGALGFVCNSYGTGLTAQEYFFHAMGGREGLVDTAVKTASTGYIQRRLSKAQEGLRVMYDSTVRNTGGDIIQFSYGGDSYYPIHLERVKLPTFKMDNSRLGEFVVGSPGEWGSIEGYNLAREELHGIQKDRDYIRKIQLALSGMAEGEMVMPSNPPRLLIRAQNKFSSPKSPKPNPERIQKHVQSLLKRIKKSKPNYATVLTRIYLRAHLGLKTLMVKYALGEEAVEWVCHTIWNQHRDALAEPGEMVGTLGASSIGAPCTQMTLNSVDAETPLIVRWTAPYPPPAPIEGSCGPWIDALVEARPDDVQFQPSGDPNRPLAYLPLRPGEAEALSPTEDGEMVWTPLEAVTRHPPLNKDGTETLLRVTTRDGRSVDVTKAKSVLVHRDGKMVPVDGDELKVGDEFCVSASQPKTVSTLDLRTIIPEINTPRPIILDFKLGRSVGDYLTGNLGECEDETLLRVLEHGCGSGTNKHIPSWAFTAPLSFVHGLFYKFPDLHGLKTTSKNVRDGISTILKTNFCVETYLGEMLEGGKVFYTVGARFIRDEDRVGDVVLDPVAKIEEVEPTTPWVYDLTVEGTRNMTAGNGLGLRDTFHTAGVLAHTVTQGVPRLKELIDLSAGIRTPSVRIHFIPPYFGDRSIVDSMAMGIEHTHLSQVVATTEILTSPPHEPVTGEDASMVFLHDCLRSPEDPVGGDMVIRFVLDRDRMSRKKLTVDHVGRALDSYLGGNGVVIWSEVNMLHWCVRIRIRNPEMNQVGLTNMALIHDFLMENVPIHGVPGIKRVITRAERKKVPNPQTGNLDMQTIWAADTEGTNLSKILALEGVDSTRTFSNDIHETLAVLGIEAATHQLLSEIRSVLSHDGAYVNDRHLQVLVDVMTHGGGLSPVTRHSMSKLGASVYTRASFEQTQEVLTSGAIMGVKNKTNGVTENIMIGNTISGGTGCCDVITDKSVAPRKVEVEKTLVKALVRENKRVLPLNRPPKSPSIPKNKHASGFVGKKRKKPNSLSTQRGKEKRNFILHSPQMRSGTREMILHSP